ncbi:hypothetical protein JJB11_00300 [Ramlibacter ginsenosidimutans]|uniref:MFS transporter permease n=1 Tax=Ramlibacter ginsenosidimutans TaxID=502333 RepID=A0A934TNW3_9BURK|nr:DUF6064 family protein [Ramlibacter ginsenosidimutans]MBK6004515.1 hypothetical protein [Ramlibacter ginsenosidimutans]
MRLPFTTAQFFDVIQSYNEAVWPSQLALGAAGVCALVLACVDKRWASQVGWSILALLWAWIAVTYQFAFFAQINPAAYAFGVLFLLGALAFLWFGAVRGASVFRLQRDARTVLGLALVLYALVAYPIWSSLSGHAYPHLPTFGLPCPTTIFTVGMLALARGRVARWVFVAPIAWCAIGVQAAFLLDVAPDLGLGVAGLVAILLAIRPDAWPPPQRADTGH